MQLRLNPRSNKGLISRNLIIKSILVIVILFLGIFLIDKIDFQAPQKIIKQKISNDKLITLK
jgi:hypothetical protein